MRASQAMIVRIALALALAIAMALGAAIWVAIVTLSWVLAIAIAVLGTAIVLKLWEIAGGTPACPRPPKLPPNHGDQA